MSIRLKFRVGQVVRSKIAQEITGIVTGICLRGATNLTYEFTYFNQGAVNVSWFPGEALELVPQTNINLGFNHGRNGSRQ